MIRINLIKSTLFLLLALGLVYLLINEVHAWHRWHDRFYTPRDVQQAQIFDIASDAPLPIEKRTQHLTNVAPLATHRMAR